MQPSQLAIAAILGAAGLGVVVVMATGGSDNTQDQGIVESGFRGGDRGGRDFGTGTVGSTRIRSGRSMFGGVERVASTLPTGVSPSELGPSGFGRTGAASAPRPRINTLEQPDAPVEIEGLPDRQASRAHHERNLRDLGAESAEARRRAEEARQARDEANRQRQENAERLAEMRQRSLEVDPDGTGNGTGPVNPSFDNGPSLPEALAQLDPAQVDPGSDLPDVPGFDNLPPELQALLRQLLEQQNNNSNNGGAGRNDNSDSSTNGSGSNDSSNSSNNGASGSTDQPATGAGTGGTGGGGTTTTGDGDSTIFTFPPALFTPPPAGPASSAEGVSASLRWYPVNTPVCDSLPAGAGPVLDLYARFDGPDIAVSFDGRRAGGVQIDGGSVIQAVRTDGDPSRPPLLFAVTSDPCVLTDTYLDFSGDPSFILFGQSFPAPGLGSGTVTFETASLLGVVGLQSPAIFGDDGYYVRIVRLALDDEVFSVGGTILVGARDSVTNATVQLEVEIPDCPGCLATPPATPDPDPDPDPDPGPDPGPNPGPGPNPDPSPDPNPDPDPAPDPDPGPDPDPEPEGAVWVVVPRPSEAIECQLTPNITIDDSSVTRDLYLRLNMPDDVRGIGFGVDSVGGIEFNGPTALQPAGNTMPSQQVVDLFPCIAFDSFFDLGEAENLLFLAQPPATDWGQLAEAAYVVSGGGVNQAQPMPDLFPGSTSFYIRVLRVTTPVETQITGSFDALLTEFGTGQSVEVLITIPPIGGN